jgi:hypothetical protein
MNLCLRCGLVGAVLFTIAGCGAGTPPALGPSGADLQSRGSILVPAGAILPVHRSELIAHAGPATYPTTKSLVFESNFSANVVNVYQTSALRSNPAPIATINGPSGGCPYGLAMDKKKNLYVVDGCLSQIEIYPKGSTTMSGTITAGLGRVSKGVTTPYGIAIDQNQTLYVSISTGTIQEYAKGSTSPTKTITGGGMVEPFGLSVDEKGNVYIGDYGAFTVFELPAGGSSVTNLGLEDLREPLGTAVDQKRGMLWVANGYGKDVNVYKIGGSTYPVQTIAGDWPYSISIENQGNPLGEVVEGDLSAETVYAFKPGSYTAYANLTNEVGWATGLLITEP